MRQPLNLLYNILKWQLKHKKKFIYEDRKEKFVNNHMRKSTNLHNCFHCAKESSPKGLLFCLCYCIMLINKSIKFDGEIQYSVVAETDAIG